MTHHTPDNATDQRGSLYVVATPIGNLADMVPRAIETLQTVALIAAEDTRHSARLLSHFAIDTPCVAYHDHSDDTRTNQLIERLLVGDDLALISDAGTPLISDPGYRLVRSAREAGVKVIPIPGPCALIAGLSASGLASDRFVFEGFLPAKSAARRDRLSLLASEERTLIFYEAPHRIRETLADLAEIFGAERELVMARELTKTFETIKSAPAADLLGWVSADRDQERGEIVLLAQGAPKKASRGIDADAERVMGILLEELPLKQAAALGAKLTGLKKNLLYQWALDWRVDKSQD